MNTSQLPYIIEIANTGSLSAAAKRLGVSQPALSKYLNELEKEVGLPLFEKSGKRMVPTEAGEIYLNSAYKITGLIRITRSQILQINSPIQKELHFGVSPHRGAISLASIYPKFMQYCPGVRLVPHDGYALTLKQLLTDHVINLAITSHTGQTDPGIDFLPVESEEIVLAVPNFHRLAHGLPLYRLEDLPTANISDFRDSLFVLPEAASNLYAPVHQIFEHAGFSPTAVTYTANIVLQEAMIRSGSGVGLIPYAYVRKDSELSYYRLARKAYLTSGFLMRTDYILTHEDRILIYLEMNYLMKAERPISTYLQTLHAEIDRELRENGGIL